MKVRIDHMTATHSDVSQASGVSSAQIDAIEGVDHSTLHNCPEETRIIPFKRNRVIFSHSKVVLSVVRLAVGMYCKIKSDMLIWSLILERPRKYH